MDTKAKLYPYPVLTNYNNDYIDSYFNISYRVEQNNKEIIIIMEPILQNEAIQQLLADDKISYAVRIECPTTCYRELVKFSCSTYSYVIPASKIDLRINIDSYLVANQDIESYQNKSFNPEYMNIPFYIEKSCILAVGDYVEITIDKESDDLANIPSIFTVVDFQEADKKDILIDITNPQIRILMPTIDYHNFGIASKNPELEAIIHSTLIIPSLIKALYELRIKIDEKEMYEDLRWVKAINKAIKKKFNKEITRDFLETESIEILAQVLFDYPINRAMMNLASLCATEGEDGK